MASIKRNLGYQTIFFAISTICSFIIAPYTSRVLGAGNLGIFSYTASIEAYFELIAALGFSDYGRRNIAEALDNREKRSKEFSSLFYLQAALSVVSIILYGMYIIFFCRDNKMIALIQGIALLSALLDINWFYCGMEEFKLISMRNIVIRLLYTGSVFAFVKNSSDIYMYAALSAGQILLSNLFLWFRLHKDVDLVKCTREEIFVHLKPNLVLFIPRATMLIYSMMDKTMLGLMSTYNEAGYYYNVDKLISSVLRGIFVVNSVMSPRMSSLLAHKEKDKADDLFADSFNITSFLFVGAAFGMMAVSKEFIPIYFGKGYESCVLILILLSPYTVLKSCGSVVRQQYLLPHKKDKLYASANTIGMIVNLIVNYIFISRYGAVGAVIGTMTAEIVAFVIQIQSISSEIKIYKIISDTLIYWVSGIIMLISVRGVAKRLDGSIISLFIEILAGITVYLIVCYGFAKKRGDTRMEWFVKTVLRKK